MPYPSAGLYRPLPPSTALSEQPSYSRLQLARVAQPRAERAVEVLVDCGPGVPDVIGVRHVEDRDQGFELAAQASGDRPRDAVVPGEVGVVLADAGPQHDAPMSADE